MAPKRKAVYPLKVEVPKHDLEPLVLQRENTKHKARYPDKGVGYRGLNGVLGTNNLSAYLTHVPWPGTHYRWVVYGVVSYSGFLFQSYGLEYSGLTEAGRTLEAIQV